MQSTSVQIVTLHQRSARYYITFGLVTIGPEWSPRSTRSLPQNPIASAQFRNPKCFAPKNFCDEMGLSTAFQKIVVANGTRRANQCYIGNWKRPAGRCYPIPPTTPKCCHCGTLPPNSMASIPALISLNTSPARTSHRSSCPRRRRTNHRPPPPARWRAAKCPMLEPDY